MQLIEIKKPAQNVCESAEIKKGRKEENKGWTKTLRKQNWFHGTDKNCGQINYH